MLPPHAAARLAIPRARPGLVPRHRLLRRCDAATSRRLTLVCAPAGFGKTTLLASWLAVPPKDIAVGWVSLDSGDRDPVQFWTGVTAALRGAIRDTTGPPPTSAEPLPPGPTPDDLVAAVFNDLERTSSDVVLVLDDYHLADHPPVSAGVRFLVEHLPSNAHVVQCTRPDPDLSLARWRVRGELLEIRAADLRFTPPETAAYLGAAGGAPLTAEQITTLGTRTEGWIAALQLAAISLQGRSDVAAFHRRVRRGQRVRRRLPGRGGARPPADRGP